MNRFTSYCTEEQTKKALLELGAPILLVPEEYYTEKEHFHMEIEGENASVILPTTEEMINWLEEQGDILYIDTYLYEDDGYPRMCGYGFTIYNKNKEIITGTFTEKGSLVYICPKSKEYFYLSGTYTNDFLTKREATLEAIDAALEYLTSKKK